MPIPNSSEIASLVAEVDANLAEPHRTTWNNLFGELQEMTAGCRRSCRGHDANAHRHCVDTIADAVESIPQIN